MSQDRRLCESIIEALRCGLVPSRGLERIVIGRADELSQIRHDLAYSKSGGAWVRFFSGHYGAGKTFLCSLTREIAWQESFVVASIVLERRAPLHKFEVIYQRIIDGMRTDHIRNVPAFEFIVQEWLLQLQQEIQEAMGLNPTNPRHWREISRIMEQQIKAQFLKLHIYNGSMANALHAYYVAAHQANEVEMVAAAGWLKGEPDASIELGKELRAQESINKNNAFDFLQAMTKLVVHIGYAGLVVICDEAETIRSISRPDSRHAAYGNIGLLMDKTTQGEFSHCGFIFAAAEDLFREDLHGITSYRSSPGYLQRGRVKEGTTDNHQPLILLKGFDQDKLYEVALNVRGVHSIAYDWDASVRLPDGLIQKLVAHAAARFGEKLETVPRGFLKVFVDILDTLRHNPRLSSAEVLEEGIDANRIEETEREEAHLLNHD